VAAGAQREKEEPIVQRRGVGTLRKHYHPWDKKYAEAFKSLNNSIQNTIDELTYSAVRFGKGTAVPFIR
jgi:hypothetical protein